MENLKRQCSVCKRECAENTNFCPYCGESLSLLGKQMLLTKSRNAKVELLLELIPQVTDLKTLSLFQAYLEQLRKKI